MGAWVTGPWVPGCLGAWVPGCLGAWVLCPCVPDCMAHGCLGAWMPECMDHGCLTAWPMSRLCPTPPDGGHCRTPGGIPPLPDPRWRLSTAGPPGGVCPLPGPQVASFHCQDPRWRPAAA
eukprot:354646-Chlamydomonas_euryale.AAC.4